MLAQVNKTLAKKGITLDVTEEAKDLLMEQGYDKTMGARPLRRVIESEIRDNVTDFYLDHIDAKHLLADVVDGHIVISDKDADKDTDKNLMIHPVMKNLQTTANKLMMLHPRTINNQ